MSRSSLGAWDLVHDGEIFEVCPNRDSVGFIARYGFPQGWSVGALVRGTLRVQGWKAAWKGVFDAIAGGDLDRIATLAHELAVKYPTGASYRNRMVLVVMLRAECDGERWEDRYALYVAGDEADTAMARLDRLGLRPRTRPHVGLATRTQPRLYSPDESRPRLDRLAVEGLPWTCQTTDEKEDDDRQR